MPNGDLIQGYPENSNIVSGMANRQVLMLDAISAVDVGTWIDMRPFRQGSLELTTTGTWSATVNLLVSNAHQMPGNGFTVTVGGTPATGDILAITIGSPVFYNSGVTGVYTVQAGDSTTNIATGLAASLLAAIQASANHQFFGEASRGLVGTLACTSLSNVVTIISQYPFPAGTTPVTCRTTLSPGATETLTVAQYDSGLGSLVPNCSFTGPSFQSFSICASWIKVACPTFSTGPITAIAQFVLP